MLLVAATATFAFVACEKKEEQVEDTKTYCWSVTITTTAMGVEIPMEVNLPMTNKEKAELEAKGNYTLNGVTTKVTNIVKVADKDCNLQ